MNRNGFVYLSITLEGILKVDVSDHFPIFPANQIDSSKKDSFVTRRDLSSKYRRIWKIIKRGELVTGSYDIAFPRRKLKIKQGTLNSPWIIKGLQKLYKEKQALHDKYLEKQAKQRNKKYKQHYKSLFERTKKKLENVTILYQKKTIKAMQKSMGYYEKYKTKNKN